MEYIKGFSDKKYGLLGEHLSHSFSPLIHRGMADYPYDLYEVGKDSLSDWVKNCGLSGYNVTIPYKQEIMQYCDTLTESARSIGAVNTVIRRDDGTLVGDNTDYYGFEYMLSLLNVELMGKKAVVLGSGGASKTARAVLRDKGAEVVVVSRSGENNYSNLNLHSDAFIVVNTTPVGMYPDNGKAPVSLDLFPQCEAVADVIYNPAKTSFIREAEKKGIPFVNGLPMLVAQAKRACEIFTDSCLDDSVIERIRREVAHSTMNVVLVGMPGCGKSTVGKLVSECLHRPFVDADEEILARIGRTPSEIITSDGERAFRMVESEVLKDICKQSGVVIATGGGAVTVGDNKDVLAQNSVVVFIERSISLLCKDDRPLSVNLAQLYDTRLPMYRDFSHISVDGNDTPENVTQRVLDAFMKVIK